MWPMPHPLGDRVVTALCRPFGGVDLVDFTLLFRSPFRENHALRPRLPSCGRLYGEARQAKRRISVTEDATMKGPGETIPSFEETYPQYPFAELVRLGVGLAAFIVRHRRERRGETSWRRTGTGTPAHAGTPLAEGSGPARSSFSG